MTVKARPRRDRVISGQYPPSLERGRDGICADPCLVSLIHTPLTPTPHPPHDVTSLKVFTMKRPALWHISFSLSFPIWGSNRSLRLPLHLSQTRALIVATLSTCFSYSPEPSVSSSPSSTPAAFCIIETTKQQRLNFRDDTLNGLAFVLGDAFNLETPRLFSLPPLDQGPF